MKRFALAAGMMVVAAGLAGCGTVTQAYKPQTMGRLADNHVVNGLEITLQPDRSTARIGDIITFSVKIKNVGREAVWIPREPGILLTWVYPDGKRDNFINDSGGTGYKSGGDILLAAGQEKVYASAITTYYFDSDGITEFRALVNLDSPTRRSPAPQWSGDVASNGFGVMFQN